MSATRTGELLETLGGLSIVFAELLDNVGADIAELLLDSFGNFKRVCGGNGLSSVSEDLLHKLRQTPSSNRHRLDGGANHISLGLFQILFSR